MKDLLVDVLAVARLTHLWTEDTLPPVAAAREKTYAAIQSRHGHVWAEGLTTCPWCTSIYVAAGVLAARRLAPRAWPVIARGLAASYATGWLSSH